MFSKNGAESITGIKIDINNSNTLINVYNQLFERYPNKNIFVIVDNLGIIYLSENTIKFMAGIKTKHIIKNDGIFIGGFGYGILNNFEIEKAIAYGNIATYLSDKESDTIKVIPNLNNVVAEYNNRYGKQPDIL
jgi:sugar/nucleoside kinase (ribokinase family)